MKTDKRNAFLIGSILLLTLGSLVINGNTQSGELSIEWTQFYDGFYPMSMVATSDEGFAILAYDHKTWTQNLLKTDSLGKLQWITALENADCNNTCELIQTNDGGYLLGADRYDSVRNISEIFLIKISNNGANEWNRTFGGSNQELGNAIIQVEDGGYLLAGATGNDATFDYDGLLVKIDQQGGLEWMKTYGGDSFDQFTSIVQNKDGSYTMGGFTNSYGITTSIYTPQPVYEPDFWLLKTDSQGNVLWNKSYGSFSQWEFSWSMIATSDGYLLLGDQGGSNFYLNWLVKTNDKGEMEYSKVFGDQETRIQDIVQVPDGGFILTGHTNDKLYIAKTDKSAEVEWEKTFMASHYADGKKVIFTSKNSINVLTALNDDTWLFEANVPEVSSTTGSSADLDFWPTVLCLVTVSVIILKKRRIIK